MFGIEGASIVWRSFVGAAVAFFLLGSNSAAQPFNLTGDVFPAGASYLQKVATIQDFMRRGYLLPTLASTQMYPTLTSALTDLRASRFGGSIRATDVADQLEANWVWWTDRSVRGGDSFPMTFYLHNRTDVVVSGIVVELADRDCDFRAVANKAYYIIAFTADGTLRPSDVSTFNTTVTTRPGMFAASAGLWCMTIVRAF
jgi:hypothetical protein